MQYCNDNAAIDLAKDSSHVPVPTPCQPWHEPACGVSHTADGNASKRTDAPLRWVRPLHIIFEKPLDF